MENGYRMTKELLQSGEPFTAVYAIADTLAIGACRALHEAGKRIPEDVSVAGFDGIPLGEYYIPKLSTMRQPVEAMAETCVDLVLQDSHANTPSLLCLPVRYAYGGTTKA